MEILTDMHFASLTKGVILFLMPSVVRGIDVKLIIARSCYRRPKPLATPEVCWRSSLKLNTS